jgi:HrpA-like RNA helicase
LYTEEAYNKLAPSQLPEIKRCDLTSAILQQKAFGQDIEAIDIMDKPELSASEFLFLYLKFANNPQLNHQNSS